MTGIGGQVAAEAGVFTAPELKNFVTDDDYAAIKPHKGSKAPGLYGKPVDEVEQTTKEEANAHYGVKTEGTNQKDLLRQLTLLSR